MKNQVAYKKIVVKAMVKSPIVTENVSCFHFCTRVNVEEHMKETEAATQRCS